tara:strand:- start:112 stop:240 length:129 start_codon:yes stop_codon:yes gene_type:complete
MKLLKEQGIKIHTNFLLVCIGVIGLLWLTHEIDTRVIQEKDG